MATEVAVAYDAVLSDPKAMGAIIKAVQNQVGATAAGPRRSRPSKVRSASKFPPTARSSSTSSLSSLSSTGASSTRADTDATTDTVELMSFRPLFVATAMAATLVLAATGLSACSSDSTNSATSSSSKPSVASPPSLPPSASPGLPAFYVPPVSLAGRKPGDLLKSEPVTAPGLRGSLYRVMYASDGTDGHLVVVTGLVAVPDDPPPPAGFPAVSFAHGTTGLADQCTPSLNPTEPTAVLLANQMLDHQMVVTATDYRGLGTPGLHPYLAGVPAGRDTLDILRAARQLPQAHLGADAVVWGHSQGGHAALFANHIAARYAPDIHLVGTVAGAPPSNFNALLVVLSDSPFHHYLLMVAAGLNADYGSSAAPLEEILTPKGLAKLGLLDSECAADLARSLGPIPTSELARTDPFANAAWRAVIAANDPARFVAPGASPLLVIQGANDEQIPVASTATLTTRLCAVGQQTQRWIYPDTDHAGVVPPSFSDMLGWVRARFQDQPSPSPAPSVIQSGCP